jgi:hypothetical protein
MYYKEANFMEFRRDAFEKTLKKPGTGEDV